MEAFPATFWTTALKDGAIVVVALYLVWRQSTGLEKLAGAIDSLSDLVRDRLGPKNG